MLEDTSAVDFHLLNKVLNVSLHGMPVRLDGVERDLCLRRHALKPSECSNSAAPSPRTAFGWLPQSAASSSSFCHGSSRVLVLITAPRPDPTSSTTSAYASPFSPSALSRGYAGSSQSDCPAAACVGWRDGALEAHSLLRALRAPMRSARQSVCMFSSCPANLNGKF